MPPKKSQKKGKQITDDELDQIVANINTKKSEGGVVVREGMTKAQIRDAEQKKQHEEARARSVQDEQMHQFYAEEQMRRMQALKEELMLENVLTPLPADKQGWFQTPTGRWVRLEQFDGAEATMSQCVDLFNRELSEPYVDFTHMYFILGWTDLCILAFVSEKAAADAKPADDDKGIFVGAIVSSVRKKKPGQAPTGYVAMLAVVPEQRKHKIASVLVSVTVDLMRVKGCGEVVLETPADAAPAVNLYTSLGFAKTKFLNRYYLQGQDAVRLKLWLDTPKQAAIAA